MYVMIILLCLNSVPHDKCDEKTAVWVMRPAEKWAVPIGCAVASQQILPVMEDADDQTHPVVVCKVVE